MALLSTFVRRGHRAFTGDRRFQGEDAAGLAGVADGGISSWLGGSCCAGVVVFVVVCVGASGAGVNVSTSVARCAPAASVGRYNCPF